MIKAEKLSYSFPQKDLYNKISFTLEDDVHCAFIGTNGTGKSTLVDMILHPDNYLYDGRLIVDVPGRIGYVSQFYSLDEEKEVTVFDYLSEEFVRLQNEINTICDEMATADELDELMDRYQNVMDQFQAIDGDFYESNIRKQLKIANLKDYENHLLTNLSGGEFKLIQVIREMMISPKFIIMDEPDVFLDFEHLNALKNLINSHKGTLLVITHNRYLLNHCFNKILHLENAELQEFDGTYVDYNFALLEMKIEQQELAAADMEEIERNRKIVERLRNEATKVDSATKGRSLKARVSLLERLEARKTKSPFVDIKQPQIELHTSVKSSDDVQGDVSGQTDTDVTISEERTEQNHEKVILEVENYSIAFDRQIMEEVTFSMDAGGKVAIVGPNGTGKTTILRDIYKNNNPAIKLAPDLKIAYLSQMHGEVFNEKETVLKNFEDAGFETEAEIVRYLKTYGFEEELVYNKVENLSGGEKNLLQLAKISRMDADFLLSISHFNLHITISGNRKIELRYLIILRIIRIKIILSFKFTILVNSTLSRNSNCRRIFYNLLIQNRKRARHTRTYRACMRIRSASELRTAPTEYLGLCCKLNMHFKSYDCFILFTHGSAPNLSTYIAVCIIMCLLVCICCTYNLFLFKTVT